jgi:PAS domain S-box-containing protein
MKIEKKDWTIPLIYLFSGLIWIGVTDALLFILPMKFDIESGSISTLSQWKGFFFVTLTTFLLHYLIKRKTKTIEVVKNDFRRLFEDNPNPMLIFNMSDYNILLANQAASTQYGYTLEEMKRLNVNDLRPDSEKSKANTFLKNLKDDYIDAGEWLHQDKFGNYFYVNVFSHKTIYHGIECRISNVINVNKKVLAELERENFEKALDKAALVSITNIAGNIQEINSEFCRISGYNKVELIGQHMDILDSGYHSTEFWNDMWQKIKAGKIWRADIRNKNKKGDFYWVDMVISPIKNHNGEVYKFMSISYVHN